MKPSRGFKLGNSPSGLHLTDTSTPKEQSFAPKGARRLSDPSTNSGEVTHLQAKLKESLQQLSELKARNRETVSKINAKKAENERLDSMHVSNQSMIEKYEQEVSTLRRNKSGTDIKAQKSFAETYEQTQFARFKEIVQTHYRTLSNLQPDPLPEKHENKVVELMLSQIRLYQTQLEQKESNFQLLLSRLTQQEEMATEETSGIAKDLGIANAGRLADMKQGLKLVRTESHTSETLRIHGIKPTDQVASEATDEVIVRLKSKFGPETENKDFLKSLEAKLKVKGVSLDF